MKNLKALEASLALVRDRPTGGNPHPSMLRTRTISASRLVKSSARELAKDILLDAQDADPDGVHWGENGNALAAMNLRQVACQEPSLRAAIPGTEWVLTGHADGVAFHNEAGDEWDWPNLQEANDHLNRDGTWFATVYENKAPLFDYDDADIEKAYRQGLLYLAMLLDGPLVLGQASWLQAAAEDELPPWHVPARRAPGQVIVCVTPYDSRRRDVPFPVDRAACDKHLARYLAKAAAVIRAVEADDPEVAARDWDDKKDAGLGEFDLRGGVPEIEDGELLAAIETERRLSEEKKRAEEAHDAAKATLERFLKTRGLQEAKAGGLRVVLEARKGGLRHFFVDDSVSLRVYGKKKAVAEVRDLLVA